METAGVEKMPNVRKIFDEKTGNYKGQLYETKIGGVSYMLRDFSTNPASDGSKFNWTFQINNMPNTKKKIELKFK